MLSKLPGCVKKMLPILAVLGFIVVSGSTDWLSSQLHDQITAQLTALKAQLMPFALSASLGFLVLYVAYLLYGRARNGLVRFLSSTGSTDKGRRILVLTFQAFYWSIVIFVAARIVAPDLVEKLFLGVSIIGAALVFALQDAAKNLISSICLHTMPKCSEGDHVNVIGVNDAQGRITKIGYLSAEIAVAESKTGRKIVLPNNTLWSNAIIVGEPEPEEPKEEKEPEPECCGKCCCCHCPCHQAEHDAASQPADATLTGASNAAAGGANPAQQAGAQPAKP